MMTTRVNTIGCGFFLLSILVSGQTDAVNLNRIRAIKVSTEGQTTIVEISGERAPNFTTFKQDNPRRVIVDVAECDLASMPMQIRGDGQLVDGVVVKQYGRSPHNVSRFVIGLTREAEYHVSTRGGTLLVRLTSGTGGLLVSAGVPMAPESPTSNKMEPGGSGNVQKPMDTSLDVPIEPPAFPTQKVQPEQKILVAMATQPDSKRKAAPEIVKASEIDASTESPVLKPVVVEPTPKTAEPKPIVANPQPTTSEAKPPKPEEAKPKPTTVEPKPVVAKPKSMVVESSPVASGSTSVVLETKPKVAQSKPIASQSKPMFSEPQKRTVASDATTRSEPQPVRVAMVTQPSDRHSSTGSQTVAKAAEAEEPPPPPEEAKESPAPSDSKSAEEQIVPPPPPPEEAAPTPVAQPVKEKAADTPESPPPAPATEVQEAPPPPPPPPEQPAEKPAVKIAPTPEREARVEISGATKNMTWVGFQQTTESSRVFVKTNEPVKYRVTEEGEDLIVLELENTRIPSRNNRRFLDTHFFSTAVTMITPKEIESVSRNVRIEIQLRNRVPYSAGQEDNVVYVRFERPK